MVEELLRRAESYIPKEYDPSLYKIRHSAAHIMAQAVVERFPEAKPTIGPPIEDRFYYDFEMSSPPHEEDLSWIEDRMRAIIKERHRFEIREVALDEARALFADNPYKLELIEELAAQDGDTPLTVYQQGPSLIFAGDRMFPTPDTLNPMGSSC